MGLCWFDINFLTQYLDSCIDWPLDMKSVQHMTYDFTSEPHTVEQSHKHRRYSCLSVACTLAIVSQDIAKHADGQQLTCSQRSWECPAGKIEWLNVRHMFVLQPLQHWKYLHIWWILQMESTSHLYIWSTYIADIYYM